ncbi:MULTISPECIES: hypothetical protein [Bacillus]|uniref:Uncharacterized protein n=2 Tax=Bacillus thuringiensis TaxID=1428 RepID=A0AAP4Q698_BACTU|nr:MULTISPECIES: hypothetical protein [Bacillus]MEC0046410.1 hypothetical protein [Bacillus cereus]AFV21775.1 hypothetical protein BTB_502p04700 [Bacillus thuringiensis Bt407]ERI01049.1 hypothetical protein BTCBT_002604 [Bacillus thuringiensis T01-328]MBN6707810.1 hypothetical protein [Bacillus thuringiensis]MDN7078364.1 hypothetical protein [Bacillus thuringiensis]
MRVQEKPNNVKDDKLIVEVLKEVKELYTIVLSRKISDIEVFILKYISLLCKSKPELLELKEVCDSLVKRYPEGCVYIDESLFDKARESVKPEFRSYFPSGYFEAEMVVFYIYNTYIKQAFDEIRSLDIKRVDRFILDKLERHIQNTLVDDPNFKGDNPYYKRHYRELDRSKKISLKCLDSDFDAYIEYFSEEEQ